MTTTLIIRTGLPRYDDDLKDFEEIVTTTLIIRTDLPSHDDDLKALEEITSI